jgi:hypothetical protein
VSGVGRRSWSVAAGFVLAALAALALTVDRGHAADPPLYQARAVVDAKETFKYAQRAFPDRCASWAVAEGWVQARAYSTGAFLFTSLPGRGAFGGMQRSETNRMTVARRIEYAKHAVAITRECYPCGPTSEFGECEGPIPDENGVNRCEPGPQEGKGRVVVSLVGGGLVVRATAESALPLRECSRGVPEGVALGSPEPELTEVRFGGAAAEIASLRPGQSATFRRDFSTGPGCGKGKGKLEMRTCTRHQSVVQIRRVR